MALLKCTTGQPDQQRIGIFLKKLSSEGIQYARWCDEKKREKLFRPDDGANGKELTKMLNRSLDLLLLQEQDWLLLERLTLERLCYDMKAQCCLGKDYMKILRSIFPINYS